MAPHRTYTRSQATVQAYTDLQFSKQHTVQHFMKNALNATLVTLAFVCMRKALLRPYSTYSDVANKVGHPVLLYVALCKGEGGG